MIPVLLEIGVLSSYFWPRIVSGSSVSLPGWGSKNPQRDTAQIFIPCFHECKTNVEITESRWSLEPLLQVGCPTNPLDWFLGWFVLSYSPASLTNTAPSHSVSSLNSTTFQPIYHKGTYFYVSFGYCYLNKLFAELHKCILKCILKTSHSLQYSKHGMKDLGLKK